MFDSKINVKLPNKLLQTGDVEQFTFCTKVVKSQIAKNPDLVNRFTAAQLDDIMAERPRITGLTWDHNEQTGVMQLVDRNIYAQTGHTGGNAIWGGGIR